LQAADKKVISMKQEKQYAEVVLLIKQARTNAYKAVNTELINC